jgi:uncharacterized protein YueI
VYVVSVVHVHTVEEDITMDTTITSLIMTLVIIVNLFYKKKADMGVVIHTQEGIQVEVIHTQEDIQAEVVIHIQEEDIQAEVEIVIIKYFLRIL